MEDGLREQRARQIEISKYSKILNELKFFDLKNGIIPRKYVQCKSGVQEAGTSSLLLEQSGNVIVDKCTVIFTNLALEVDILLYEARSKYYNALLLYGEDADGLLANGAVGDHRAGVVKMMSNFFPLLYELNVFISRCYDVARNILRQLHAFFNLPKTDFPNARASQLMRMWLYVGDLLCVFVTFDEIIRAHPTIVGHWRTFVESVRVVEHNAAKFHIDMSTVAQKFHSLLGIIAQIQTQVIDARIFENFCNKDFGEEDLYADYAFAERFQLVIMNSLLRWEKLAHDDAPDKLRLLVIICLAIFHYRFVSRNAANAPLFDKKLAKSLWDTQKYLLVFHLAGDILWTPLEFLMRHVFADTLVKAGISRKALGAFKQSKSALFQRHMDSLQGEVEQARVCVSEWKAEMRNHALFIQSQADDRTNGIADNGTTISGINPINSGFSNMQTSQVNVGIRYVCVLKGARIADRISRLVKYVLNACLAEDCPLTKTNARHIFRLIELISAISATLNFHWPSILEWSAHARTLYSGKLLALLDTIGAEIFAGAQRDDSRVVDVASALQNAVYALYDTPTRQRIVACSVALEIANYHKVLRPVEVTRVDDFLTRLDTLYNVGLLLSRVCDFSFLFWHRSLAGIYFESALFDYNWPIEYVELFFESLNQCCVGPLFASVRHCTPGALRKLFQNDVFNEFKKNFLSKLCADVETDLRLTCHQRQEISAENVEARLFPTTKNSSVSLRRDQENDADKADKLEQTLRLVQLLRPAITLDGNFKRSLELRLGDRLINVREFVSAQLDSTFYNLTTVALHDCETYTRMRLLARTRYALDSLSDAHLPHMKVEQGLDMLMITRNIHVFVENYAYDLIEQIFIERFNKSRALNVVHVEQVVNSIKTHGAGILNSLVHLAYQYLRKKFQVFSQFLHDEHIKSRLVKEIRHYRDHIDQLNEMYPLKRAEGLNTLIRKMGVSADGKSFLDKFRELITHVGNTLGLVRMLRAGALESHEYAASFVSHLDLNALDQFVRENENDQRRAAENSLLTENDFLLNGQAADVLATLAKSAGDALENSSDFIETLISVFSREFRNHEKFAHLRHFFVLIPALCVNYVEYVFTCRNRLGKQRSPMDADFTFIDDGFCFGIAYVLRLLNQGFFFDSLNWFESVRTKLSAELGCAEAAVRKAQKSRLRDESLTQALTIKLGRAQQLLQDYEHLEHTLMVALIFFRVKESSSNNNKNTNVSDQQKAEVETDQRNILINEDAENYLEEF